MIVPIVRRIPHGSRALSEPFDSGCLGPRPGSPILEIVVSVQIFLFAQNLTMEQPRACANIDQTQPIGEYEKFTNQDNCKRHINRVATKSKDAIRYKSVRMLSVNADSKALPKGDETPQEQ